MLLLYGLVAPPLSDPRVQDRVAAVLASVPGGPGRLEGRRRVREGLPLIVGLSRERTEELQGCAQVEVASGDVFVIETPGGGGYGPPGARDIRASRP